MGLVAWSCVMMGAPGAAVAELVYFTRGGQAQLPARMRGDRVVLETPDGPREFLRGDFRRIVPGFWPPAEWEARRAEAQGGSAEERFAAAWWALENGLTPEAEAMLRDAHAADPSHQPTARLVAVLDRLARSLPDPDLDALGTILPGECRVARGPHVLVLHQHDPAEAAERVDLLERVLTTFYLVLAAQGYDLPVPSHRLASAWFARQEDYRAFLRAEVGPDFQTTSGYYHPTRDLVAAWDSRDRDDQRARRDLLRRLDRAGAAAGRDRLRRDVARQLLLLDLDRRAIDLGTAAHEQVHQLVALTGLAPRYDDFPIWLHEGFAAQFEVIRGGRWAGVGRAHDIRLADWREIPPRPARLIPLLGDVGLGHGYQPGRYAEAWALVYYLRKQRPRQFVAFLDLLRTPDPDPAPRSDRTLAAFCAVFGEDLDALEASWLRYLAGLQTPLESERPSTGTGSP
jgi:hypothetical protein